ncbi:MAG: hypothetical protein IRZ32_03770 [Solirubrobacteraceae bacterium]|nr:hypothetical protein [Solirubrobacteraceae bacterium]
MCLHGFMETWHAWSLALPALERRHEVLAPTLPGHAGGPPPAGPAGVDALLDGVVLDDVGHAVQLDVPLEAAQLVLGHTGGR